MLPICVLSWPCVLCFDLGVLIAVMHTAQASGVVVATLRAPLLHVCPLVVVGGWRQAVLRGAGVVVIRAAAHLGRGVGRLFLLTVLLKECCRLGCHLLFLMLASACVLLVMFLLRIHICAVLCRALNAVCGCLLFCLLFAVLSLCLFCHLGALIAPVPFPRPYLFLGFTCGICVRRRVASMGQRHRPVALVALSLLALAWLALACLFSEAVVWRLLWDLVLRVLAVLLSTAVALCLVALMALAL